MDRKKLLPILNIKKILTNRTRSIEMSALDSSSRRADYFPENNLNIGRYTIKNDFLNKYNESYKNNSGVSGLNQFKQNNCYPELPQLPQLPDISSLLKLPPKTLSAALAQALNEANVSNQSVCLEPLKAIKTPFTTTKRAWLSLASDASMPSAGKISPQLDDLTIENADSLTDMGGLENLTALRTLTLCEAYNLKSLAGIEKLASLMSLNICDANTLISLRALKKASNLFEVTIEGVNSLTSLESLSGIGRSTFLSSLEIYGANSLSSLAGLENLPALRHLKIRDANRLTSLAGIENSFNLRSLEISGCRLSSLKGLEKLSALEELKIYDSGTLTTPDLARQLVTITKKNPAIKIYGDGQLQALYEYEYSMASSSIPAAAAGGGHVLSRLTQAMAGSTLITGVNRVARTVFPFLDKGDTGSVVAWSQLKGDGAL